MLRATDRRGGGLPSSVSPVSWETQARTSVAELTSGDVKYRSPSLALEVKLVEALNVSRAKKNGQDLVYGANSEDQLLRELADALPPFRNVIEILRTELALCIFSEYYVSTGGSETFEQVPYFVALERLEAEKTVLMQERNRFLRELKERAEDISKFEGRAGSLEHQLAEGHLLREKLEGDLAHANKLLDNQQNVDRLAKEEAVRTKKELLRCKEELMRLRVAESNSADSSTLERLRRTVNLAQKEVVRTTAAMERVEHELMLERESNKLRPTVEMMNEARAQMAGLEEELGASRRFGLTPRPDWPRLRPEPLPGETSASTRAIAEAMAAALERAKNEAVVARADKADMEVRYEQLQAQVRELQRQLDKTTPPPSR